ncbi:hypothetical protein P6144_01440 [Sphingomonas sp. HITSZ_GF]|uniref:hypothetical protein n=1 Tax=Sphingomonas sp. HITSZ_GF TaxID=3037247 RepID=UPI00240E61D8|nr:hypothetical protein [Sphingomonas sp. HITSZ_GF]MDG2532298.1 hypothetical protein [Sphingomonas sp. HITSZ_GF]
MKALEWDALGEIPTERGIMRRTFRTRVEPFVRARSTSWLEGEAPASARMTIIEPDGAWREVQGTREALPTQRAAHERAQYGLYGYLLELQRTDGIGAGPTEIRHPGLPPISFLRDANGRPISATYVVPDHASDGVIDQRIDFEGEVADQGITWPKRITLRLAKGAPGQFNFRNTIDNFTVIRA